MNDISLMVSQSRIVFSGRIYISWNSCFCFFYSLQFSWKQNDKLEFWKSQFIKKQKKLGSRIQSDVNQTTKSPRIQLILACSFHCPWCLRICIHRMSLLAPGICVFSQGRIYLTSLLSYVRTSTSLFHFIENLLPL